jgi:Tol biopolymer transport system component
MNRRRNTVVSLGVLLLMIGLGQGPAVAIDDLPPIAGTDAGRDFIVVCPFSHRAADDPIAHFGQPGDSHLHDFWGNTSTNANSTLGSLLAASTTCNRPGDLAAYWMPTVLSDGKPVAPADATFYYRGAGLDPADVAAFPPDFRMIAGDPSATTAQPLQSVEWACRDEGAKKPWRADIPTCPAGSDLAFRVNFPDCWNGRDTDSADHRSHVAYRTRTGVCPATHPRAVPQISMTVTFPDVGGGRLTLSSGSPFSGHADFLNAWQQSDLQDLIQSCLVRRRQCSSFQGPGGAGPIAAVDTPLPPAGGPVAKVLRTSDGRAGAGHFSQSPALSGDGRWLAFETYASGVSRIMVLDRSTGVTSPASVAVGGGAPNGGSYDPSVSADGRYVAFRSSATNLVPNDSNASTDIFVRDVRQGVTTRESVSASGAQADFNSFSPAISADGRWLAFESFADNLISGDTNRRNDIFERDRQTGQVARVSVPNGGGQSDQVSTSPSISADGRYVAFDSWARNLTSDDQNSWSDVYVRDMVGATTTLVSASFSGPAANSSSYSPSISGDGTKVAFESAATNVVPHDQGFRDVFVRDVVHHSTVRVSGRDGHKLDGLSSDAALSADGRWVTFQSANSRLLPGDGNGVNDVVVVDLASGRAWRASTANGGSPNDPSGFPSINGDGSVVTFESTAGNLVAGGRPHALEVYVATGGA